MTFTPSDLHDAVASQNSKLTVSLLAKSFKQVADGEYTWLNELKQLGYSYNEIADELLEKSSHGPWILGDYEEPNWKRVRDNFHLPSCLHSERTSTAADLESAFASLNLTESLNSKYKSSAKPQLSIREDVEYLCGLGGIRPTVWGEGELDCVSFETHTDTTTAFISLRYYQHGYMLLQMLHNFETAAAILQKAGGACDSFTFLAIRDSYLELQRVEFRILRELMIILDRLTAGSESGRSKDTLGNTLPVVFSTWSRLFPWLKLHDLRDDFEELFGPDETGAILSIIVGFVSLAIISYSQAHAGPIQPFFLDTPQEQVIVHGNRSSADAKQRPCIVGTMVELTCMGEMMGKRVLAFQYLSRYDEKTIRRTSNQKFDLVAHPEDILDTWGPGELFTDAKDTSLVFAISVGGGTIMSSPNDEGSLHWSRGPLPPGVSSAKPFARNLKAKIGSRVVENPECQADTRRQIQDAIALLEELGTFPGYWEVQERQFGLGVQAGQTGIAALQFNQTWIKMRGVTKKSRLLSQPSIYTTDLESEFGIQVSVCTGIARRVQLRHLLADVLPVYVSGLITKPRLWTSLHETHHIIEALRGYTLKDWLSSLDHDHQRAFENLVTAVLFLLQDTGVDREGDNFVVACIQPDLPFQCFKVPCRKESYWTRILADSEDIATFAYITSQCLETTHVKCQGPAASWANTSRLLKTAVSCYQERNTTLGSSSSTTQWTLKHSEAYLIGPLDASLFVQVDKPDTSEEPRLLVKSSSIPSAHLRRLYRKGRPGKPRILREKKASDQLAENVVVLMREDR